MKRVLLVSDTDCRILNRSFLARLLPPRYDRGLGSDRPITEFVALAKVLGNYGFEVHPLSRPPYVAVNARLEILKFGTSSAEEDWALLRHYGPRNVSEWNRRNLDMIEFFNSYVDLGRRTWNINLRHAEGQAELRRLLSQHGALFVKSVAKGHAAVVTDFARYLREFGNLDLVDPDSLALLVSEVIPIREIEAAIDGRKVRRTDEWRHHIYRGQRVATTHAFDCDEGRTSCEHRDRNIEHAEAVAARLRGTDFATSYVLDTCTLEDGGCTVVEANSFFSSGIYSTAAVEAIGKAVGESPPG
jgi:hypothetical protein